MEENPDPNNTKIKMVKNLDRFKGCLICFSSGVLYSDQYFMLLIKVMNLYKDHKQSLKNFSR